jgi:hypothetical protein
MAKRKGTAETPGGAGNVRSVDNPGQTRAWTAEEMAEAKPMPVPTVNDPSAAGTAGVPHAGKGQTNAAGKPEQSS